MRTSIAAAILISTLAAQAPPKSLAPYYATPPDVVDRMLVLAEVGSKDVVYDLGSGDGRIPIAAAVKHGAKGVGIEIDPVLIAQARGGARAAGVDHLVEFRQQDAMTADVSAATVVTLYLLSSSNAKLKPLLTRQLRPGSRIVSHAFSMGPDWPADKVEQFTSAAGDTVTLYLWKVDGKPR